MLALLPYVLGNKDPHHDEVGMGAVLSRLP